MTPVKGLAAFVAAFVAGLTLTIVAINASDDDQAGQRVETDSADDSPLVALADSADRSLIRVAGDDANEVDSVGDPGNLVDDRTGDPAEPVSDPGDLTDGSAGAPSDRSDGDEVATLTVEGVPGAETSSGADGSASSSDAASTADATASAGANAGPTSGEGAAPSTTSTTGPSTTGKSSPTTATTPTTKPATSASPSTTATTSAAPANRGAAQFESIRNRDPLFERYANVPSNQLSLDALTIPASVKDNGAHPDGNFRMACAYSHFSYDDPIVFPGQPGKAHLHMFYGNTRVDASTTTNSLVNSGGGSCNGFELNRSGYWSPAILDGKGNVVVPDQIILYYKTKHPEQTVSMPQGLKIIAGNPTRESFTANQRLGWSCGASGTSYNRSNRIPNNCGSDPINAYVQFPFCWDGKNLDSADHMSHMAFVNDNQSCPSSHPVRLPQITILLYYPPGDTSGWYLSSDHENNFGSNTGPGATLHADWFGGWNEEAIDLWVDGCIRASRNCSYGQTGTSRMFAKLNNLQTYQGNNFLPMP